MIIAGFRVDELHLGIFFRKARLYNFAPFVHVGCRKRGGNNSEFTLLSAQPRGLIHERLSYALRCRLVHKKRTRIRRCVAVKCDDLDALFLRSFKRPGNAFSIFTGNSHDINTQSDPVFDNFILSGRIGVGWAVKKQLHAELLDSLARPLLACYEIAVALAFRHEGDCQFFRSFGPVFADWSS